ncbi:carbonyl reductase [NADPH] 1-like [Colias croceus]|uniref:carbonyl reductase [NADPH] 1-like n=1 Tax=Colias crocea TaxID=72248 RepID=UPI001E27E240|nr:carbonyl reductase [NADPH] 1-like [Colias croceus]
MESRAVNLSDKIAVVTGSNKGVGFGIVKELCKRGVGVVYLTSRDINRGKEAIEILEKEKLHPKFHQLDVSNEDSVKSFAEYIKKEHNGLDILINNAGLTASDFHKTTYEDAKRVIDTNYYGVLLMQKYFFPIMNENGRIINVSSVWGHIRTNIKNSYWIQQLTKENVSFDDVNAFVTWFLDSVKNGTVKEEDFVCHTLLAYRVSKVALCALTKIQQTIVGKNISVNSMHPGFVRTKMTNGAGDMSTDDASIIPVYLALDADQSVKGKYICSDRTEVDWEDFWDLDIIIPSELFKYYYVDAAKNYNFRDH